MGKQIKSLNKWANAPTLISLGFCYEFALGVFLFYEKACEF